MTTQRSSGSSYPPYQGSRGGGRGGYPPRSAADSLQYPDPRIQQNQRRRIEDQELQRSRKPQQALYTSQPRPAGGPPAAGAQSAAASSARGPAGGRKGDIKIELDYSIGFAGNVRNSLALHPNKQNFIYVSGGSVVVGDLKEPQNQRFFRGGHVGPITQFAVSPDGSMIATGGIGSEPDVIVWDFKSGKALYSLQEHDHGISALAFSDDGRFLATCGDHADRKLFIWDMKTGMIVSSTMFEQIFLVQWGGRVRDKKRRPTSNFLFATVSGTEKQQKVSLWSLDPRTGRLSSCVCKTGPHVRNYTSLCFSPDGEWFYCGTGTGDVAVFTVQRSVLFSLSNMSRIVGTLQSLTVPRQQPSGGGLELVVGGSNGTVARFTHDGKNFKQQQSTRTGAPVTSLSVSDDGSMLLAGTLDGSVMRVDGPAYKTELVLQSQCSEVNSVGFGQENPERFITTSESGRVTVWDSSKYRVVCSVNIPNIAALCAVMSDDVVIVGFTDGVVRAFDAEDASPLWKIPNAHRGGVTCIVLSTNDRFIVTGGLQGDVRVWDLRTRKLVCHLKEHTLRINQLCLYDSNKYVLSCCRDRSFLCWDLMSERRITAHSQTNGGINGITLTADQKSVITVGKEQSVSIWDLRNPRPVASWRHGDEGTCVAVARTLPIIATGGVGQVVKVWDLRTGKLLCRGVGHSAPITDISFSPDDKQIVSVGRDACVMIWNVYEL